MLACIVDGGLCVVAAASVAAVVSWGLVKLGLRKPKCQNNDES